MAETSQTVGDYQAEKTRKYEHVAAGEMEGHRWGIAADQRNREQVIWETFVATGEGKPVDGDEIARDVAGLLFDPVEAAKITYLGALTRVGATAILATRPHIPSGEVKSNG